MDNYYITFEKARELLRENLFLLDSLEVPVRDALSYILAEDIFSPIDLPPFSNSAMDGYALRYQKSSEKPTTFVLLKHEMRPGEFKGINLAPGEAIRVFTGSPIPSNTDAVVMKEFTEVKGNLLWVKKEIKKGENIRLKGEEIKKGQNVLKKGTYLGPAHIAFLSMMGISNVVVTRKPRVYVIVTGDEIMEPGRELLPGKVYDANSFSLHSLLIEAGLKEVKVRRVRDNFDEIRKEFYKAIEFADIILFSGGISAGEYDFVKDLMKKEKVKTVFYKVRQKPGKPIYFGVKHKKLVFALPGNPASIIVCFYEYVYPAIRRLSGFKEIFLSEKKKVLLKEIKKKTDKLWFLKGKIREEGVLPLDFQQSHMLSSFAKADALIVAPRRRKLITKGERIRVHLLPYKN